MSSVRRPTILCIDDEANALGLRKRVLEKAGYKVVPATTATIALQLFKSQPIDLVICDHLLPDLTGADLTREMKRVQPSVPVMLFSALVEAPKGAEHADMFVSKAGGPVELLEKVSNLLRSNRITEGSYFAEIRCNKRLEPQVWHYTIQHVRTLEILVWSQAASESAAIESARDTMRAMNKQSPS